ncbi:TPA: chlorohydrolase [Candidatus Marinimicrobia bacterium]|nr:MAG: 5-methylthioadenosine/S-adenosylhomocysteine deaminase [Marinimicrobia bacterium 46_47]KUK89670.1 MAG: amidohydrolase [Marinimicrobia bacterium 46_43]HAE86870.1 chlorohydrolase [Candidatus Neomarinimicrobiota bacterium]HBY18929.1 chlorohydrolase [Candidatus Neomarinimicrobiota bacterium]
MTSLLIKEVVCKDKIVDVYLENGIIQQIESKIVKPAGEIMECRGRKAILPAFYNGHTHAAMTLLRGYADDLPLFEWLNDYIWPAEATFTPKHIEAGARLACLEMIRSGTVFFNDMYWNPPVVIKAASDMGMRICTGPIALDAYESGSRRFQQKDREDFLLAMKSYSDLLIPSLNAHSIYSVLPETLETIRSILEKHDLYFHIHLSETQKEVEDCLKTHGCRPVEYLDKKGLLTPKTIAAHGIHLTDREREILARKGVTLVHMPVSNMKLSNGSFDIPAAEKAGLPVILGTDGASSNNCLDMMGEMKVASLLAKHVWGDVTMLPAEKVYHMATRAAAEAFGLHAGVIEEGRLADAILVDLRNPRLVPGYHLVSDMVYSADSSCIDSVICNGRFLMKNKQIEGEEAILEDVGKWKISNSIPHRHKDN